MVYQLVQTEANSINEHHSRDNPTTHGKQRVRISNLFSEGFHDLEFKSWLFIVNMNITAVVDLIQIYGDSLPTV